MLTVKAIEALTPREKNYCVYDDNGLMIEVTPLGTKRWVWKFRFMGVDGRIRFGVYPVVTLALARKKVLAGRQKIAEGIDPRGENRRRKSSVGTFADLANSWMEVQKTKVSAKTLANNKNLLDKHALPIFGGLPLTAMTREKIVEITPKDGKVMTRQMVAVCSRICRYGVVCCRMPFDPFADLTIIMDKADAIGHFASLEDPHRAPELIAAIRESDNKTPRNALLFIAYTACRRQEALDATWDEFDLEKKIWTIPAERMKAHREHRVPLSDAAIAILLEQQKLKVRHVFPATTNASHGCHSKAPALVLAKACDKLGVPHMVIHGFRSVFSSICNEKLFAPQVIEGCLAHQDKDKVRAAYNRTDYLEERRTLMAWYAKFLDGDPSL